jgi:Zn-dependent peptidase ImmA (M78 family)
MRRTGKHLSGILKRRKGKRMIEFNGSKVDKKDNTPILRDTEIDELAEMLLADYKPQLLKQPAPINYLHFLESYLGANIEFMDIYYENKPIWGATSFNDAENLKVFDRESRCTRSRKLTKRTIVIDNYVMQESREGLALFTGLHEGGHLWLHPGVYKSPVCNGQLSILGDESRLRPIVCCRRNNIESFGRKMKLVTSEDFREHQADYFASAIAMPKSTFIPIAKEILKSEGISGGRVIRGTDFWHDWFAEVGFPKKIAEIYGVSKQAAAVKLRKFGFIVKKGSDVQASLF